MRFFDRPENRFPFETALLWRIEPFPLIILRFLIE